MPSSYDINNIIGFNRNNRSELKRHSLNKPLSLRVGKTGRSLFSMIENLTISVRSKVHSDTSCCSESDEIISSTIESSWVVPSEDFDSNIFLLEDSLMESLEMKPQMILAQI